MTNAKTTKRALLTSVTALFLCFTMLLGTTFAWFTDTVTSANNIIMAGNLDVELYYQVEGQTDWTKVTATTNIFKENALWEPGHTEVVKIKVVNEGSLALKYNLGINVASETGSVNVAGNSFKLSDFIKFGIVDGAQTYTRDQAIAAVDATATALKTAYNSGTTVLPAADAANPGQNEKVVTMVVYMPTTVGNEANAKTGAAVPTINLGINLLATQQTAESDSFDDQYDKDATYPASVDEWDGTADISWFLENPGAKEFTLDSAEDFAGFAALINGTAAVPPDLKISSWDGYMFKLGCDVNLYLEDTSATADGDPVTFRPIGDHQCGSVFEGVFDGQGHTIYNLYQNGWDLGYAWGAYGSYGLFGIIEDATIKNLTISGAESYIEGGDVGGIAGSATGDCVFENITIKDSVFATYNNGNGGIVAWSGEGKYTFKNITIADDVVLAGLWGSFDSSIGGIVGQGEPGATYNFENVDVACRLDAYNDCTASYDYYNYRMCGMLIGRLQKTTTIDGANYPDTSKYDITCKNVTVTYGEWADYHYCEPTPGLNGGRGMRVEPGYAYDGLPADYDHTQCVDNHMYCIPFDQIFGGDQLGVKGLKSYDGVTVIYNNDKQ